MPTTASSPCYLHYWFRVATSFFVFLVFFRVMALSLIRVRVRVQVQLDWTDWTLYSLRVKCAREEEQAESTSFISKIASP